MTHQPGESRLISNDSKNAQLTSKVDTDSDTSRYQT